MDMLKQLNAAISYIEANLRDEIDFKAVAQIACLTKDSFMRFFSYMTGITLHEYIRRRRLTLAAYELQSSNSKVIDTAGTARTRLPERLHGSMAFLRHRHETRASH